MCCVGEMLFHIDEHCAKNQFDNHLVVEMLFHMDEFFIKGEKKMMMTFLLVDENRYLKYIFFIIPVVC